MESFSDEQKLRRKKEKNVKKKLLSVLLAGVMCMGVLTGCGGNYSQEPGTEEGTDAPETGDSEDSGETGGGHRGFGSRRRISHSDRY